MRPVIILLLFVSATFKSMGQKLPKLQVSCIRAPANTKIDGKVEEWRNSFAAFSKNIEVYYRIANDDQNLYLVIQSVKPSISSKILRGGISFVIDTSGKSNWRQAASITFPKPNKEGLRYLIGMAGDLSDTRGLRYSRQQMDSIMSGRNKQEMARLKEVDISGIAGFKDTTISVYNDVGFKARVHLKQDQSYTYELSAPLKSLGLSVTEKTTFSYTIRLNGVVSNSLRNIPNPFAIIGGNSSGGIDIQAAATTTSITGKYELCNRTK